MLMWMVSKIDHARGSYFGLYKYYQRIIVEPSHAAEV